MEKRGTVAYFTRDVLVISLIFGVGNVVVAVVAHLVAGVLDFQRYRLFQRRRAIVPILSEVRGY